MHCPGDVFPQSALVTHGVCTEECDDVELFGGGQVPFAEHTWPSGHSVPGVQAAEDAFLLELALTTEDALLVEEDVL